MRRVSNIVYVTLSLQLFLANALPGQSTVDLTVTPASFDGVPELTVAPLQTSPNGFIRIGPVQFANAGGTDAGAFSAGVYLSTDASIDAGDINIRTVSYGRLQAGATVNFSGGELTIPSSVTAGQYFVGVLVDETNVVSESDETNNAITAVAPIEIRPPVNADLVPGPLILIAGHDSYSPLEVAPQAHLELFNWAVSNQGGGDAQSFTVGFYISTDPTITRADRLVATRPVNGLRAGAFRQSLLYDVKFELPPGLTPGQYYFGMLVDSDQQVLESALGRETNNTTSVPFTIVSAPSDRTSVWRVEIQLWTKGATDCQTDDDVYVSVNPNHQTWLDYAQNDFEQGDHSSYDLTLEGIQDIGDIQYIKIGKVGDDGWCLDRLTMHINDTWVFDTSFAPAGKWIDLPRPNDTLHISYARLRGQQRWRSASFFPPPQLSEKDMESIVQATVGNKLRDFDGYWGSTGSVKVTFGSVNSVHVNVQFKASVPGPDPTVIVDFDVGASCFCGALSMSIGGFQAQVSSAWYPGWLKDAIAAEINSRVEGLTSSFGSSVSTGTPICPVITVLAPPTPADITFSPPPFAQDLDIQGTIIPAVVSPGQSFQLMSTARNVGNQNSNPFSTNVFLVTGTAAPATSADVLSSGVRLGGISNGPAVPACGTPATWREILQVPATIACSEGYVRPERPTPRPFARIPVPSRSTSLATGLGRGSTSGRQYWIAELLTGSGEPVGANNLDVIAFGVTLPDLRLQLRSASSVVALSGRRLSIGSGQLMNQGGLASDSVVYEVVLARPGGGKLLLRRGTLSPMQPWTQVAWPGLLVDIPSSVPPGAYELRIDVHQQNGGPECDLTNNSIVALVEVT